MPDYNGGVAWIKDMAGNFVRVATLEEEEARPGSAALTIDNTVDEPEEVSTIVAPGSVIGGGSAMMPFASPGNLLYVEQPISFDDGDISTAPHGTVFTDAELLPGDIILKVVAFGGESGVAFAPPGDPLGVLRVRIAELDEFDDVIASEDIYAITVNNLWTGNTTFRYGVGFVDPAPEGVYGSTDIRVFASGVGLTIFLEPGGGGPFTEGEAIVGVYVWRPIA